MKKLFGIEAEFNITADEEVVKGIGKGIANGAVDVSDIIKEVKPNIVKAIKEKCGFNIVKGESNNE